MREGSVSLMFMNIDEIKQTMQSIESALTDSGKEVDWEQRRYEIAKSAMQGKLADHTAISRLWHCAYEDTSTFHQLIAESAVQLADALIAELKKE